jgi:hypothetical protein
MLRERFQLIILGHRTELLDSIDVLTKNFLEESALPFVLMIEFVFLEAVYQLLTARFLLLGLLDLRFVKPLKKLQ